jgi:hypothetical protein
VWSVLVFAFATLSVDRIAFARNRARNGNLSIRFAMCLGSVAVIAPGFAPISRSGKLFSCRCPVPSVSPSLAHTSTWSSARALVSASTWERLRVIRSRRLAGRRHLHWQLVSAHNVIGTHSSPDTTGLAQDPAIPRNPARRNEARSEAHRRLQCLPIGEWFTSNPAASKFRSVEVQKIDFPTFRDPAGKKLITASSSRS